jgi:hypothetical protein
MSEFNEEHVTVHRADLGCARESVRMEISTSFLKLLNEIL